jgi:hypothetical protein
MRPHKHEKYTNRKDRVHFESINLITCRNLEEMKMRYCKQNEVSCMKQSNTNEKKPLQVSYEMR